MRKGKMTQLNESLYVALATLGTIKSTSGTTYTIRNILKTVMSQFSSVEINLFDAGFGYPGEFFERYAERNFELDDMDKATMTLFYALAKNEITDADFNENQATPFLELIQKENIENPIMDFAKYLLFEDETHIANMSKREMNIDTLCFISKIAMDVLKDTNLARNILVMFDCKFAEKTIFTKTNLFFVRSLFDNLGRQANKEVLTKNSMLAVLFKSANAGKITSKAMLKTLTEKGFSELNIDCMNYFMLRFVGNSDLKLQRVAWATYDKLCQKEDVLDELEKATIESIYSIGKFGKKMDGGNITSMRDAINETKAYNAINNMSNYEFIIRDGILNANQIDKSNVYVDVLQDENAEAKITFLKSIDIGLEKQIIFENIKKHSQKRDEVEKILEVYTSVFEKNVNDLFSYYCYASRTAYTTLCDLGIFSPLDDIKKDAITKDFWVNYLSSSACKGNLKLAAIKLLKEIGKAKEVENILPNYLFSRRRMQEQIFLFDVDSATQIEYISLVGEIAFEKGADAFRTFCLNILLNQVNNIKHFVDEETKKDLYSLGLSLANTLKDKGSYSYSDNFYKQETINDLNFRFMSEEEKLELQRQRQLEKEAAEKARKEAEENEVKQKIENRVATLKDRGITNPVAVYEDIYGILSYGHIRTAAYRNFVKNLFTNIKVREEDVEKALEVYGDLFSWDLITFEEMKTLINSMELIVADTGSDEQIEKIA